MPGIEVEGFRIVVNTRDERGYKPYVYVLRAGTKRKIMLAENLTPYDIVCQKLVCDVHENSLVRSLKSFAQSERNIMAGVRKSIPVPELTDEMYARGRKSDRPDPHDVVAARYSRANDALQLILRNGIVVTLPRHHIRELAKASPTDLMKVEIHPGGDGITFRSLNVDISVLGLLADELGSIFAREMGRKTKGRTSTTKAAASRENGRKGGRPRKAVAA